MGVPERGICNDKIDEATTVKVAMLYRSDSGYNCENKLVKNHPAKTKTKYCTNVKFDNIQMKGSVLNSHLANVLLYTKKSMPTWLNENVFSRVVNSYFYF